MNILKNLNSSSINVWQNARTYMDAAKKIPASFHDKARQWIVTFSPEASLDQYFFQSITSISSKASTAGKALKVALKTIVFTENPFGNQSQEKTIKIITGLFLGAILGGGIFFSAQSILQGKIPGGFAEPDGKSPTTESLFSAGDSILSEEPVFNESLTICKNLSSTDETTFMLSALGIATLIIGGAAYSVYNSTIEVKDVDTLLTECQEMNRELEEEKKLRKKKEDELLLKKYEAINLMEAKIVIIKKDVECNDGSLLKFDESEESDCDELEEKEQPEAQIENTPGTKTIIYDVGSEGETLYEELSGGSQDKKIEIEMPCMLRQLEELKKKNAIMEGDEGSVAKVKEDCLTQAKGWIEMSEEEFSKINDRKKTKIALLFAKLFDEMILQEYIKLQKSTQSDALREIMEQVKQNKIQKARSPEPIDNSQCGKPPYVYSDDSLKRMIGNERAPVVDLDGIPCVLDDPENKSFGQQLALSTQ